MRRLLQVALMIGGICLLILVGIMLVLRREASGAAWLIYQSGDRVYRGHPDGRSAKPLLILQRPAAHVLEIPDKHEMLLMGTETDQMGRTDQVLFHVNFESFAVEEVLRLHELFDIAAVFSDRSQLLILTAHYSDLYLFDWQQETLQNLTETPNIREQILGASPNGDWILYVSHNSGNLGIQAYSSNEDRVLPLAELMQSSRFDQFGFTTFSPDGEWMYLLGQDQGLNYLVRIKIATGRHEVVLQSSDSMRVGKWSPNGHYLALMVRIDNATQIFIHDLLNEHNELQQATNLNHRRNEFLEWSADSEWIVCVSIRESDNTLDYYRVRRDGSSIQQMPSFEFYTSYQDQSDDGQWYIFQVDDERNRPILYSLNFDQREQYQLTLEEDYLVFKTWSPDGNWLYFVGGSNGNRQLFRVQIDGTQRQQITYSERGSDFLLWSPTIDLDWNAERLALTTVAILMTSIGFGYWTSRVNTVRFTQVRRSYASEVPGFRRS